MNSLADAWQWYQATKSGLGMVARIARRYWNSWDADSPLGRDRLVRDADPAALRSGVESALVELNEFAVFVLFSAFESEVRRFILEDTRGERAAVTHPTLQHWIRQAETSIEEGSFYKLLEALKTPPLHDEIELVNQVRKYRNWVAHGRRGTKPDNVTPTQAYERLSQVLARFRKPTPPAA